MSAITLTRASGVARVLLNRPKARNALNPAMIQELRVALRAAAEDPTVRAVVLEGAGGTFCAGADVQGAAFDAAGRDALEASNRDFGHLLLEIARTPVYVVVLVEGAALGGGFGLACVADMVLAIRGAVLGMPEVRLGLVPAQIAPFVARRVGVARACALAARGARFSAEQAFEMGIVDGICADRADIDRALSALLDDVAACGPTAMRTTKRLFTGIDLAADEQVVEEAARLFIDVAAGDEAQEGLRAFGERRKAKWHG